VSSANAVKQRTARQLGDLQGIGPAMLKDFELLNVRSVDQLAEEDGLELYERLNHMSGARHDPCVLDTFRCAVAQAKNPRLSDEKRKAHLL
jgi:hypothetical protein